MSDNVVRDRLARVLWRFACPPKLREELAGSPPPVFVEMADAVMAELAAIRAENTEASAMDDYLRNIEVMDRAGFLARYGQGDAVLAAVQAEAVVDAVAGAAAGVVARAALGVAADGGMHQVSPSEESLRAAPAFMAAMTAEELRRSLLLPPVVPAVEWASVGCGGAPIALVVVEGPSAGVRVALDRPKLVIGRAEDCDVRLADELVSQRHARLVWEPPRDGLWGAGRWLIEDLGSVNGVFVGGTRAFTRLPVAVGVRVQVGGSVFVLQ